MTERDLSVPQGKSVVFKLQALGVVSLVDADGREVGAVLTQPKRIALLTYLATQAGKFQRRDTLLGLFWPEQDQRHARAALRKAVHVLRRALGAKVILARGDEDLAVDAEQLWCDAAAFTRAVARGDAKAALQLYTGDLLEGFFLAEAPEFERWMERERAWLRSCAAEQAWQLAERALTGTRPIDAARWARRAVEFTPDDEAACRDLISLLYRVGDRAGALRVYEEFAARVQRELGTRPSALTRQLVEDVRSSKDIAIPRRGPGSSATG